MNMHRLPRSIGVVLIATIVAIMVLEKPFGIAGDKPVAPAQLRAMLDRLQYDCLMYIWEGGDPATGMAYEASFPYASEGTPLAVGGTGFGVAAILVGVERGWIPRSDAAARVLRIVQFLHSETPRKELHGAFPHWLHHETGEPIPFSEIDDGADLVETALLLQGLLLAKHYFDSDAPDEIRLRRLVEEIWREVEWDWFAAGGEDGLYWHWSRNHGFKIGMKIQGFNECLIVYLLAMASPTHPISEKTYRYWQSGPGYETRRIGGRTIEATFPEPGPLFFSHYSFIGLNPHLLADAKVPRGYFNRNVGQALANREYCLYRAPGENRYGPHFWGLTASLVPDGYTANDPANDTGTVAPTAALASFPYTPFYSYQMLSALLRADRSAPGTVWKRFGPVDAINLREEWRADGYLAIDQLPIMAMVENYRSGLLWNLLMDDADIARGLRRAGIHPPVFNDGFPELNQPLRPTASNGYVEEPVDLLPHPERGRHDLSYWRNTPGRAEFIVATDDGLPICIIITAAEAGANLVGIPLAATSPTRTYRVGMVDTTDTLPVRLR